MPILIEKREGETPLQALERLRASDPTLADSPMTYAGRLDPMASGKLLLLVDDECKERAKYDGLDKEYEFEMLCGFSTDTGDILGVAERGKGEAVDEKKIQGITSSFVGKQVLLYPAFSSKTVNGKPLFQYALEGTLNSIDIPTKTIVIYTLEYFGARSLSTSELLEDIKKRITTFNPPQSEHIGSDFRKEEILTTWELLLTQNANRHTIYQFSARVSAGTYIRSLVPRLAEKLGTTGLAYSIRRTKIEGFT